MANGGDCDLGGAGGEDLVEAGGGVITDAAASVGATSDTGDDLDGGDGQMHGRNAPPTRTSTPETSSPILAALH